MLTRIISFFLLPIYTAYIAKQDMGYFDLTTSYLQFIVPVVCLVIWSGMMRFMFDFDNAKGKYQVILNGMTIFGGSLLVYTVLFVVLGIVKDVQSIVLIFFLRCFSDASEHLHLLSTRNGIQPYFALSGIISSLVNSLSNIFMILVLKMRLNSCLLP